MFRLHPRAVVMLTPADPAQLAALDAGLSPGHLPAAIVAVLDTAEVYAETIRGQHTTEAFGRHCLTAVPTILRRLLDAETDLATLRAQVARHAAAADRGDDPTMSELLYGCQRAGIDLRPDVQSAAAVLDAEVHSTAIG